MRAKEKTKTAELEPFSLGINPMMDEHAHKLGFTECSCIDPSGNYNWMRRDGLVAVAYPDDVGRITFNGDGYSQDLRRIDRQQPQREP